MTGKMRRRMLAATACVLAGFANAGEVAQGALTEGAIAPEFRLQDQNGKWHTLADYRGRWVTLYFYPKDGTPGCTKEACAFRDNIFAFDRMNAAVIGVSLDDVASHEAFAEKYSLPFPILADSGKDAARAYGVYTKIGNFEMARRESFLIDPAGRVARHYQKVDPEGHTDEVLADLRSLAGEASQPGS